MTAQSAGLRGLSRRHQDSIPQPKARWKTRLLVPAGVLGAVVALVAFAGRNSLRRATAVRVVPVVVREGTAGAPRSGGAAAVQAPGWIEPDPFPVYVTALTDGVVEEVLVLEGARVDAGQVVARMIKADAELTSRRADADLAQRRAELADALAALEAAQRTWDNPVDRTKEVAVAEAVVAEAIAELEMGHREAEAERAKSRVIADELERTEAAFAGQAAATSEIRRLKLALQAQEATASAYGSRIGRLEAELRHHQAELDAALRNFELRIAETLALESAKARVSLAEGAVAQVQAMCDEACLALERTEVRTPSAGIVQSRLVDVGTRLMTSGNDPLSAYVMRLYDPARLQVRVDIALVDAAKVGVEHLAEVTTEALPGRVFNGRVTRLVQEANIQKNTVQVKVAIDDPAPELRPEMLAKVRFYGGSGGQAGSGAPGSPAMFIPVEAIAHVLGDEAHVWVVDRASESARTRQVRLGTAGVDGWTEVLEGLNPGDRLIVGAPASLDDGDRVRVSSEGGA